MRKTKMALAVVFCVASLWVAFQVPPDVEGGFFIGAVLGWLGAVVVWSVWDWQLFMMKQERRN